VKILLVEDDQHTCELMAATLEAHRYAVDVVTDGESGLEMALQWPYDLILLDVMLPRLNGIEVCRRLRAEACQTPILILTTRGASEDVIAGLDAGADDYVVKSCEPDQLMARVRALLRRGGDTAANPILTWGDLCLDPSSAQVTFEDTAVSCRPKEYTLLELFLRNPQRLLSRSSIIDHLWAYDDAPVEGSVTTLVKDLRRRLKAAGVEPDPIETVYGLGYRLKPEPQAESDPPIKTADHERLPSLPHLLRQKTSPNSGLRMYCNRWMPSFGPPGLSDWRFWKRQQHPCKGETVTVSSRNPLWLRCISWWEGWAPSAMMTLPPLQKFSKHSLRQHLRAGSPVGQSVC
jgi:DNA-binding response OmpR family regulator